MIGYDQDTRPGAAARLEQMLARILIDSICRAGLLSLAFLIHGSLRSDALFSMISKTVFWI